jgi:hypothetical protein
MRAVTCQTWILRIRRFSMRKGSLGRKRKRKRRRETKRRDTGEEEEEEEEERNKEEGNEEGNEEDEPVSSDDMENSVIAVASGRPRGIRL